MAEKATSPTGTSPPASSPHFSRKLEWLLSPEHFHFKLLLGAAVGVIVIIVLAVTCFVVTYQSQQQAEYRAHTIRVMRLSSVVENDIAALENAHRGYLLNLGPEYFENFERRKNLFQQHSEDLTAALS